MSNHKIDNKVEIYTLSEESKENRFPFIGNVSAGFPSPAADFIFEPLDILGKYMKHPEAIYIGRAYGVSMDGFIAEGDYFFMDRSLRMEPKNGDIVVCAIDGEFTLKRIEFSTEGISLIPYNEKFPTIQVAKEDNFTIWAVVVLIIRPTPTRCLR